MCYPVCGMLHIKDPLLLLKVALQVLAEGYYYTSCGALAEMRSKSMGPS